ncbi:diacylglycerol kinase [Ectothiorhodospiraceae bacterium BW-2]|nr:diacylglycerol kinase [Ectothiorhodospiraceae bacterium BW-2]
MASEINKPAPKGLARLQDAARYSWAGFRAAVRHEESFRLELMAGALLFPAAFWITESALERIALLLPLLLVLITELLNSALETVVDRISTEHHPLSGRAKDIGSAACFLAQMSVILVWSLLLLDKF